MKNPEEIQKRRSLNKKIFQFGCLPIVFFWIVIIYFTNTGDKKNIKTETHPRAIVYNSPYDNSVFQVERYLKENLNDPDSYDPIEWWAVQEVNMDEGKYFVRHKFRAKNSFGALIIENKVFFLDSEGKVTMVK